MSLLFGNFDSGKRTSLWKVPLEQVAENDWGNGVRFIFANTGNGLVRPYYARQVNKTAYLFFTTIENHEAPQGNQAVGHVCDFCAVLLGGAIFEQQGHYWLLKSKNLFLDTIGSHGKPPEDRRLREWATGLHGLEIVDETRDPDLSAKTTSFFGFHGNELYRVFNINTASNDCILLENPDRLGYDANYDCKDQKGDIEFIASHDSKGVFDLEFRSATKFRYGSIATSVSRYVFSGNRYFDEVGLPLNQHDLVEKAKNGSPESAFLIGCIFRDGQAGVPRNYVNAKYWHEKAANLSDSSPLAGDALSEIGVMYQHGSGVSVDLQKALDLLEDADRRGSDIGAYNLGYTYYFGIGVKANYETAKELYIRAADRGLPLAATALGHMYEEGQGVDRDDLEARKWYDRAAQMPKVLMAGSSLQTIQTTEAMTGGDSQQIKNRYYEGNSQFVDTPEVKRLRDKAVKDIERSQDHVRQILGTQK
jgi:TPR repeat protein